MIIYAHRGASEYAPENTLSSFYLGVMQGANGIETDIQMSKDNVAVLFHDDTLERVTGQKGSICDYTIAQLKQFKVTANAPGNFFDRIVTLEEFLSIFSQYDLQFALELKSDSCENTVLSLVNKYRVVNNTTITSFNYEYLSNIYEKCDYIKIGLLVDGDGTAEIDKLKAINANEICPKAECITPESVKVLREAGFSIRPWGVYNTELMKKMCHFGVDGMTVNFPDRLYRYVSTI